MTTTSVTVTERAAHRINEIVANESANKLLRVSVEGGGCSGFQYKFGFDEAPADDDLVIRRDSAAILIDAISLQFIGGSQIDFVDELIGQSFKIANPNAKASCGFGTSFTL